MLQALDLLPLLIQTVEKAASQSTQVPTVTEGVAAALLLSKLSVADAQAGKSQEMSRKTEDKGLFQSPREECLDVWDFTGSAWPLTKSGRLPGSLSSAGMSLRVTLVMGMQPGPLSLSSFTLLLQCSGTGACR